MTKRRLSLATQEYLENPAPPGDSNFKDAIYKVSKDFEQQGFSLLEARTVITETLIRQLPEGLVSQRGLLEAIRTIEDAFKKEQRHEQRDEHQTALKNLVMNCGMMVNVADKRDIMLVDRLSGKRLNVDRNNLREILGNDYGKFIAERKRMAQFIYDPHAPALSEDKNGIPVFNRYSPPEWKRMFHFNGEPVTPVTECPKLFMDFLIHLTNNDQASITFVLDWLANAIHKRNQTMLTCIGDPGIGKGILGLIMQNIVGEQNLKKVRDQILKGQFNAAIRETQILHIDEICIKRPEEIDRLKDLVNDTIEIEAKGRDSEQVRNFANVYICSNRKNAVRLEGGDRRISVIELTNTPFRNTPLQEHYQELIGAELSQQIGCYLYSRAIKSNLLEPFRSKRAEEIMEAGLPDWANYVVFEWPLNKVLGSSTPLSEVQAEIFGRFKITPGREKFEELGKQYPTRIKVIRREGKRELKIVGAS